MGMDDYWKLSEVPGLAKTPSYFDHEKYGVMFHAVGEIRGNFPAHELLNHVMTHRIMHMLLNKTISLGALKEGK